MQKSEISRHWRASVPVRLLATSVATACGVVGLGVLGAQSAAADVPGYGISGTTDSALGGCTGTGAHWQGLGTFNASADLTVPTGVAFPQYHFKVVQAKTAAPVYASDGQGFAGTVRMSVPTTSFVDGGSYSWTIGLDLPDGTTQWSAPCTFKVDLTAPPLPTVALTDGYGDTPPPRRTPRAVTFSVPAGSDVKAFCYTLGQTSYALTTLCGRSGQVKPGADGTATVTIVPVDPGTNILSVWTIDRAHNITRSNDFAFSMGWGTEDRPGDLNGDAKVDLFAIKGDQLELLAGQGDGRVAKATVTSAVGGTDLTGAQLARIGDVGQNGNNTAYVFNGYNLFLPRADGVGDLASWGIIYPPQSDPFDDDGSAPSGPGVDMTNWSTVTQITGAVNVEGDGESGFFALNSGQIQYFPARFGTQVQLPLTLAPEGADTRLVAAQDFNGDGKVDLLVREGAQLQLFAGNGDGTFAAATAYAKGLNASKYTQIVSDGDANGDGLPDLWATTAAGKLVFLAGTGSSGFAKPVRASGQDMTGVSIF